MNKQHYDPNVQHAAQPEHDPYDWARFKLQENIVKEQVPMAATVTNSSSGRPRKKRGARLLIGLLCMALLGGAFGSAGTYLLLKNRMQSDIDQAVTHAINSLSLQPSTNGSNVSYQTSDVSDVIEQASEGIVAIMAEGQSTSYFGQNSTATSAGSGVIIRADGIVVTCAHVIADSNKVKVYLKNGQEYEAEIIGSDEKSDLAVLKIKADNLHPVVLGDSSQLKLGESVIAIGNPLGELNGSVTVGVISALDRSIAIGNYTMSVLQTDAAINPGNSGGALFNSQGQLIGIVNAKTIGTDVEGLGFAIPLHRATSIIEQLLTYGYVKDRPYIGISMQEIASSRMGDKPGVYIVQVYNGTGAEKAGLAIGDRIVSIDGKEIKNIGDIDVMIDGFKVGQTISMVVERNDKQLTIPITLTDSSSRSK